MARPPGADDEYQELQKRFQILESERKNLFEHTQLEVKKNKEALGKLKKENKELRSNLSSLMYASLTRLALLSNFEKSRKLCPIPFPQHGNHCACFLSHGQASPTGKGTDVRADI
jgi:hypothetical protein